MYSKAEAEPWIQIKIDSLFNLLRPAGQERNEQ
jgi:hypothetical protein